MTRFTLVYFQGENTFGFDESFWSDPGYLPAFALTMNNEDTGLLSVMTRGRLRGTALSPIDTSSWSPGDILWGSGASGGLTNTRPSYVSGAPLVKVGTVIVSDATLGIVQVDVRPIPAAGAVLFTPGSGIVSENVQAALEEVADDAAFRASFLGGA